MFLESFLDSKSASQLENNSWNLKLLVEEENSHNFQFPVLLKKCESEEIFHQDLLFFVMVLFDFISSTIFFGGVTKEAKNKAKTNR